MKEAGQGCLPMLVRQPAARLGSKDSIMPNMELGANDPSTSSVALFIDDQVIADGILSRFDMAERPAAVARIDPATLRRDCEWPDGEVAFISLSCMRRLADAHGERWRGYCASHTVVLVMNSVDFIDSWAFLEMAGGVWFLDTAMPPVTAVIALAKAGLSVLPPTAVMDIVGDRLRCDAIATLSGTDLAILDQLGEAKSNRSIGCALGLSEAQVKTRMRSLLRLLKCQNRTAAAVFITGLGDRRRRAEERQLPPGGVKGGARADTEQAKPRVSA